MRTVRIPSIDWATVQGVRVSVPVKVDWPELQLTLDQIAANGLALAAGDPYPFPDLSTFEVLIDRPSDVLNRVAQSLDNIADSLRGTLYVADADEQRRRY